MKAVLSIIFLITSWLTWSQPELQKEEITDEISILVPTELRRTPPTMQRSTSPALAIFNSKDGQTDLGINQAQIRWGANDLDLLSQFYKANILNLFDNVTMHDEGIKEKDGRQFIFFEFTGTILDEGNDFSASQKKSDYTYILYTINEAGVLIFRFTAPAIKRSYWQPSVSEIMSSISFKEGRRKKK